MLVGSFSYRFTEEDVVGGDGVSVEPPPRVDLPHVGKGVAEGPVDHVPEGVIATAGADAE